MTIRTFARILTLVAPVALGGCSGLVGSFDSGSGVGQRVTGTPYELGKQYYAAGQYGLAIKQFQTAVRYAPESVEALNGLAASYDRLGRYDLSARYYGRALTIEPQSAQTLNNMGYSYLLQERFDLAVAYLRDAYDQERGDTTVAGNWQAANRGLQSGDPWAPEVVAQAAPPATSEAAQSSTSQSGDIAEAPRMAEAAVDAAPPAIPAEPLTRAPQAVAQPAAGADAGIAPAQTPASAPPGPVIMRSTAQVQTLVTEHSQTAFVTEAADVTVSPRQAAYKVTRPQGAEFLPDLIAAPIGDLQLGPQVAAVETIRGAEIEAAITEAAITEAAITEAAETEAAILKTADVESTILEAAQVEAAFVETAVVEFAATEPMESVVAEPVSGEAAVEQIALAMPDSQQVALAAPVADDREEDAPLAPLDPAVMPLVEISNGTGRLRMAARMRDYLRNSDVVVGRLTNASHYSHFETTVYYRGPWRQYAQDLARLLPAVVELENDDSQRAGVRIELGGDLLDFDRHMYYAIKRSDAHAG